MQGKCGSAKPRVTAEAEHAICTCQKVLSLNKDMLGTHAKVLHSQCHEAYCMQILIFNLRNPKHQNTGDDPGQRARCYLWRSWRIVAC